MGIIALGAFLVALIGALIPGVGGLLLFSWLHDQKDRGTWLAYVLCACMGSLVLVAIGVFQFPSESPGAPTRADYSEAIRAVFLIGLAPGSGLLTGCLAAVMKRGDASDPS